MPFMKVKLSCPLSLKAEMELKSRLGKAVSLIPGKQEDCLLIDFEADCRLWLGGSNLESVAYIETDVFENETHFGYEDFSSCVTSAFSEILGIRQDHIFIKFEDIAAWAANGTLIDRVLYR